MYTRFDIDAALSRLEEWLPGTLEELGVTAGLSTFLVAAESLRRSAPPHERNYVWTRVEAMMREAGLTPAADFPAKPID